MNNKERLKRIIPGPVPAEGLVPFTRDEGKLREAWNGSFAVVQHGFEFWLVCLPDHEDGFIHQEKFSLSAGDGLWILETLKLGAFPEEPFRRRVVWAEARGGQEDARS